MTKALESLNAIADVVLSYHPPQNNSVKTTPSKIFEVGPHRIIQADCISAMQEMKAGSVDLVVTSPPYNINLKYSKYNDDLPKDRYLDWMEKVGQEIKRVLKDDGSFFLNVGGTNKDPLTAFEVALRMKKHFTMQNYIIWIKSVSIADESFGHFKPINSARYLNHNHEHIFHFTKTGSTKVNRLAIGVPFKDKSNIARWGHKADKRCAGDVWFIPYKTVQSKDQKYNHPCTFPVELPQRCIRLHGKAKPVILDPFLGTGATLVAAQREGGNGIGIDIDGDYCKTAIARLTQEN